MMKERETKFASAMRNNERKHFHNEDLQAGVDFEAALKLGCFDKEFLYYAVAYDTPQGIACRVSAKERAMQHFVHDAVEEGLYPTPIKRYIKRLPAPSGQENEIKIAVKKEAARAVFALYNDAYFQCLGRLASIEANDQAYGLLANWQDDLEGLYQRDLLELYRSLVHTALESKVLTMKGYLEFKKWMGNIDRQLESDILPKGQYKKNMTAFAYKKEGQAWRYFYDAWEEVSINQKYSYDLQGYLTTPVFTRTRWLNDMNEFRAMRESFMADYQRYCEQGYLACLMQIKALPGVISQGLYEQQSALVEQNCSPEALEAFGCYKNRWNIR